MNDEKRPFDFEISFRPINEAIKNLPVAICNRIDRERRQLLEAYFEGLPAILRLTVRIAAITFDSIRFLIADQPVNDARRKEFAVSVPPMARTILDAVFNVVFIFDDPAKNARRYYAGGWLNAKEHDDALHARHGADPTWVSWLAEHHRWVDWMATDAKLTAAERANPATVKYWPHPGRMLRADTAFKDAGRRTYLELLDDRFYGHLSQDSHGSLLGISRGGFLCDDHQRPPNYDDMITTYKTQVFLHSLTIYLALLSEITVDARLGFQARELVRVWKHIRDWSEATELFDARYGALLEGITGD